ncbi:MAG: FmdB family zinc ribbon protein [Actinomycetota bacterium]
MPTYEYKCLECSDVFETVHGMNESLENCPRCGGRVRRLFHPVGIIFKGSGFYKTDSRASDNGKGKAGTVETGEDKTAEKASVGGEKSSED